MSSGGFANPIVNPEGALVYPQVMSPNFDIANPSASPANSWALLKSGLAYIFGLVLSGGTITGPDYIINPLGAFFYNGTPGTGNRPRAWIVPTGTTQDPFGNAIQNSEIGTQSSTGQQWVAITGGIVEVADTSLSALNPIQLQNLAARTGALYAPTSAGTDVRGQLQFGSAAAGGLPAASWNGSLAVGPITSTSGTAASPTLITTDTWTTVTPAVNWAAGARTPQARLYPDNTVRLRGQMKATAATLTGATMFTLAYTFAESTFFMTSNTLTGWAAGGSSVAMNAGGTVTAQAAGANGNTVNLDGCYASID